MFDIPVESAVRVLRRIDELKLQVHYVTARTAVCRQATEEFLRVHGLPGAQNLHLCPDATSSRAHKRKLHESLARKLKVIVSIGDSDDEEEAAGAMAIPFIRVALCTSGDEWLVFADRITEFGGFKP